MTYKHWILIGMAVSFVFVWIAAGRMRKCRGEKRVKKPFWITLTFVGVAYLVTFGCLAWNISDSMIAAGGW